MLAIDDFEASILTDKIRQRTDGNADVTTDGHGSYASLGKDGAAFHYAVLQATKRASGNSCRRCTFSSATSREDHWTSNHDIRAEFLQLYPNESCHKFIRRYPGFKLFDRLELYACMYRAVFKHGFY